MAYEYTNKKGSKYYLHSQDVTLKGNNRRQTIYFFAKEPRSGALDEIPSGYKVVENTKTGLPVLKRG